MSEQTPVIQTSIAQMGDREHLFAGYEVFGELLGEESLMGLLTLSVGLPRLTPGDLTMLEDLATVNALCDSRIWPVKVARLVASYGSALHGFSAGNLMHANSFIGAGPCQRGAEMLQELMRDIGGPEGLNDKEKVWGCVEAIVSRERWPGFGVPFRVMDERMDALKKHLSTHERSQRPYWRLLLLGEEHLLRTRKTGVNILGGIYAAMLDMSFSPTQCAWMLVMILQMNFSGPAYEGAQQQAKALRELPSSFVDYQGSPARLSPRATQKQGGRKKVI
jgi:hypothetical protein